MTIELNMLPDLIKRSGYDAGPVRKIMAKVPVTGRFTHYVENEWWYVQDC